ncbi:K02A2.6-like [Cordylochernes scorpioides]|uniref:K02A2.6-like n=1 Tax=Cordylochernes scorpioides TaxID=51811 RepID=A0ABY6KRQ8_9ARAC|nr:K02A2.6-like [Cordylochernes scorpioides]
MEGIKPPAEFVPYSNEKKWETWRESFEIFAIAVNLESMPLVRQRAILKHIAGEKTVMIYKTFHISENDTYPNVKEMLDMLTNHFKPFKNTIQRRNAFFTCVQKERQGIMEFVTELKHQAQECEFENLTQSLIRDRLIIGILDREVKRKLLEDPQLTLPRAISIAVISESTCSQVASLNEQKMIEKIEKRNWVKDTIRMENAEAGPSGINPRRERRIEPCKWCGQRRKYGKCPAYGKKCNACGKTNHFSVVCRTKRIRNLLAESEAEESCDEINLNEVAVKTVRSDKWSAVIIINGKKTTVHLDTGAQINVLPHKVINQWPSRPEIRPTSLKAFAYGNTELPIVGKCNVLCQYGEKKGMFEFIVADVEAQTLITGDTCEKLEILRRINHINTDEMKLCSETQKILEQYHEVFQGVGLINSECHDNHGHDNHGHDNHVPSLDDKGGAVTSSLNNLGSAGHADSTSCKDSRDTGCTPCWLYTVSVPHVILKLRAPHCCVHTVVQRGVATTTGTAGVCVSSGMGGMDRGGYRGRGGYQPRGGMDRGGYQPRGGGYQPREGGPPRGSYRGGDNMGRGSYRGDGPARGSYRGDSRGSYRGDGGYSRGSYRGGGDGPMRGSYSGEGGPIRGSYRGEGRGSYRGDNRGGMGSYRGDSRGGSYRGGDSRGSYRGGYYRGGDGSQRGAGSYRGGGDGGSSTYRSSYRGNGANGYSRGGPRGQAPRPAPYSTAPPSKRPRWEDNDGYNAGGYAPPPPSEAAGGYPPQDNYGPPMNPPYASADQPPVVPGGGYEGYGMPPPPKYGACELKR